MKPIELPYFKDLVKHTASNQKIYDCDIRKMTFYSIDNISECKNISSNFSEIMSGGKSYIIPMTYEDLIKKINYHNS